MSVFIPPDVRVVLDAFWQRKIRERFGDTPPTPEEEIAYIDEFLGAGVPTVPLPDGSEVTDMGAGMPSWEDSEAAPLPAISHPRRNPPWRTLAGIGLIIIAIIILVAPMIKLPGRGESGQNTSSASEPSIQLPAGIDSLIESGEVRVPLVVPRTLEILPSDGITGTTFVVVPVEVKQADWPCPVREFGGRPAACWVFGTLVNYLVGVPDSTEAATLVGRLRASGGLIRLRLSTERVISFHVAEVITVERHQVELLSQKRFALTMPLLGQEGALRTVVVAYYDPSADVGETLAPLVSPTPSVVQTVGLGQTVAIGSMDLAATGSAFTGSESRLDVLVSNRGDLPLAAGDGWRVTALLADGSVAEAKVQGASVSPGGTAVLVCTVNGQASAWRIALAGVEITVVP